MARSYTTWAKVTSLYELADDIEPDVSTNQADLITAKSDEFHAYIRKLHKADLTAPLDEIVKLAVAHLVVEELRQRRHSDDDELELAEFPHITGKFTSNGLQAHGIIAGILRGHIVLTQDHAQLDVHKPEPVTITNAGGGRIETVLPYTYTGDGVDIYRIKCTTAGRADDGSAVFSVWCNEDAVSVATISASTGLTSLGEGLYIRFLDAATTGDSFDVNDEWTVTALPEHGARQTPGPRQLEFYSG